MLLSFTFTTPWATNATDVILDVSMNRVWVCKKLMQEQQGLSEDSVTSQRTVASVGNFEFEVPSQGLVIHLRGFAISLANEESNRAVFKFRSHRLVVKLKVEPCSSVSESKSKESLDVLLLEAGLEGHIQFRALPFGKDRSTVGGKLWPCALLVVGWLRQWHAHKGPHEKLGRVVELGAGTGVCGVAMAAHGAGEVFLTDSDGRVLSCLLANVGDFKRRISAECLTVERLDFSSVPAVDDFVQSWGAFDLVVASDVIYEHKLLAPLLQAARKLLRNPSGRLVLGIELRPCGVDLAVALPEVAAQCGFILSDCTNSLKSWTLQAPAELNLPPLEVRHRLFVGSLLPLEQETG